MYLRDSKYLPSYTHTHTRHGPLSLLRSCMTRRSSSGVGVDRDTAGGENKGFSECRIFANTLFFPQNTIRRCGLTYTYQCTLQCRCKSKDFRRVVLVLFSFYFFPRLYVLTGESRRHRPLNRVTGLIIQSRCFV